LKRKKALQQKRKTMLILEATDSREKQRQRRPHAKEKEELQFLNIEGGDLRYYAYKPKRVTWYENRNGGVVLRRVQRLLSQKKKGRW